LTYLFSEVAKGRKVLAASTLIFAECRRDPKVMDSLFDGHKAQPHQLSRLIARSAGDIGEQIGVKPPDAVHVATALAIGCGYFVTFDESLAAKLRSGGFPIVAGPPQVVMPVHMQPKLEI